MSSRLVALALDTHHPARLARFWAGVLDRAPIEQPRGVLLPGSPTQVGLRFAPSDTRKAGLNRVHPHLTSDGPHGQRDTVAAALALGAHHLDVGQQPEERHIVLADPEGNEFCVIEPGNSYLAGCGFLGELACDGTRLVGLFWSEALGWPLVWDENEETAVQSPQGGTKVAWGGPPVAKKHGRNAQRFELAAADGDLAGEVDRLVALGATRLGSTKHGGVELADPDGNEFCLTREEPRTPEGPARIGTSATGIPQP
ncbi:MAG TPA: VOC family protein [Nocardioidaceae bacterium]|nr:VOC family protein [Nocardioidaceae bacterium]